MWIFTKEAATGIVRTFMPFLWTSLLGLIPSLDTWVTNAGLSKEAFIIIGGSVLYAAIRWIAEKVPAVGWLLVVNTKPTYN